PRGPGRAADRPGRARRRRRLGRPRGPPRAARVLAGRRVPRRHAEPLPVVRALAGADPRGGASVAVALAHGRGGPHLSHLCRAGLAHSRRGPAGGVRAARAGPGLAMVAAQAEPAWRRVAGGVAMSPEQSGRGRLAAVPWRTLTTRVAYQNPWIRIDEDQVEMPDGRTT